MNKFIFLLIMAFSVNLFAAEFKSADAILKKLSAYKVADVEGDIKRLKNKEKLKIDEMFDDLEAAAKFFETGTPSEEAVYQLERVSLITFIHDPSTFAVDLILPVYIKNTALFKKAAKRLHPVDATLIMDVLEGKADADSE